MSVTRRAFLSLLAGAPLALAAAPGHAGSVVTIELSAAMRARLLAAPYLDGAPLAAPDLEGRVVVVSFFASWCLPCEVEFTQMAEAHDRFAGDGVTFVAVDVFEEFALGPPGKVLEIFLARHQPAFSVVEGDPTMRATFANVTRIPTLFVFDAAGRAVFRFVNERDGLKPYLERGELESMIEDALDRGA